jgi:hypothetical protein
MTAKTNVPKLKGSVNFREWFVRIKAYMIDEGSWDAVLSNRLQRTPNPESPDPLPEDSNESVEFTLSSDDVDIFPTVNNEWVYHPKNSKALRHILEHCEYGPAMRIDGIPYAKDAMKKLTSLYGTTNETEKYLLTQRIWNTFGEQGKIQNYVTQMLDAYKDITRLSIDAEFMMKSILVHHLPEEFKGFKDRKREAGLSGTQLDDLAAAILEEDTAMKSEAKAVALGAKPGKNKDKKKDKEKPKMGKDHVESKCRTCQDRGPDECWYKHPDKASEWWRKRKGLDKEDDKSAVVAGGTLIACGTQVNPDVYNLDSGAGPHVSNNLANFVEIWDDEVHLSGSAGSNIATKRGIVEFDALLSDGTTKHFRLSDTIYSPSSPYNLVSLGRLRRNAGVSANIEDLKLRDKVTGAELASLYIKHDCFFFHSVPIRETACASSTKTKAISPMLLHRRMGHLGFSRLKQLVKAVDGIDLDTSEPLPSKCEVCSEAKLRSKPFGERRRATRKGEITHVDLVPKISPVGYDKSVGYVSVTDDKTAHTEVHLIKSKDEAADVVKNYQARLENEGIKMAVIYSDLEPVLTSKSFQKWMYEKGIKHEPTVRNTPEENGLAEITQFHLHEKATSMLIDSGMAAKFWPLSLKHAEYMKKRAPARRLKGKTPYEAWYGKKPNLLHANVFGSKAYYPADNKQSEKMAARGLRGRFVGYDSDSTIHLIWSAQEGKVVRERSVDIFEIEPDPDQPTLMIQWLEGATPTHVTPDDVENDDCSDSDEDVYEAEPEAARQAESTPNALENVGITTPEPPADETPDNAPEPPNEGGLDTVSEPDSLNHDEQPAPEPRKAMRRKLVVQPVDRPIRTTRGKAPERWEPTLAAIEDDEFHHYYAAVALELSPDEALEFATIASYEPELNESDPTTITQALNRPDGPKWEEAADQEIEQIHRNHTFSELMELPPGKKAIDLKWVFKLKRGADNEIVKYKGRVVARGFMQEFGLDYYETYAGVVRSTSVRVVLALAAFYDLEILQLDFVNAYLNSDLEEEVYVRQPPGYVKTGKEHLVHRVLKGLYGLKQSARAWNKRAIKSFQKLGFKQLQADPNVLIKGSFKDPRNVLIVTLYVDDVKLVGGNESAMLNAVDRLNDEFELTNLGNLRYYLGIKITRDRSKKTIRLSQKGYVQKTMDKYGYRDGQRRVKTPMTTGQQLDLNDFIASETSKLEYASKLGSANYSAILTRPDIAYAESSLAQHAANPGSDHEDALKRLFLYLRHTEEYGITYGNVDNGGELIGYSDASFADDLATRKSTGAYIFMLNGGPISWSSKRQSVVALSSTEAEYIALSDAAREAAWLRQLLSELGHIQNNQCIKIHVDNQSSIALGKTGEFHKRSKHIDVKFHYVRDQVDKKLISTPFLPSTEMLADPLTKSVGPEQHQRFLSRCRIG